MMQTVFVSFLNHEQDSLLPPSVQRHWREELHPIISRDIQRGHFGERHFNLGPYSVLYRLDLADDALRRIRSNLQFFAEDNMRYMANLREALRHASIWLSFDKNAIRLDEVRLRFNGVLTPPSRIVPTCSLVILPPIRCCRI